MDIQKLLNQMTLDEKIGQLIQLNSVLLDPTEKAKTTGPNSKYHLNDTILNSCGSVLNFSNAESVINLQNEHLKNDRNKIPMLFMQDVIHGYRTIYPIPLAMGCTFDSELVRQCARMSAVEAATGGVMVNFSPMLDLVRDARWGRVMESTGEDPYLNSILGKAFVDGYQGDMTSSYNIASCVKHFAAYGAAEAGRDYNTVDMSEHTLREYYLPAYKAAVDAGAEMVMPSFNTINGIPSSANKWLLDDVLRNEWGFGGVIISDFAAIHEMVTHGFAENDCAAAEYAMNATCDIEMMSGTYPGYLKSLTEQKKISEKQIDDAVMRVLQLKEKLGLFENPYKSADIEKEKQICLCQEHRSIARKAAESAAVLLKNDGILPLSKSLNKIAVIGPFSNSGEIIGFWSCHGDGSDTVTVAQGIRRKLPDSTITIANGCGYKLDDTDDSGFDRAVNAAREAECVVLCIGEYEQYSGEGNSRSDICIPDIQMRLARKIYAVNPNTVILLFTGRPLAIPELDKMFPAILNMWQPGTEGGNAAANLLFGDAVPSGKLSMSFPYTVGQCPIYYNHFNTGRPLKGDYKTTTYTSRYQDCPNEPLYPFGYGLSYSDFKYSNISLSSDTLTSDSVIIASVDVCNTGRFNACEVVQLYIRDCFASRTRPVKELKKFEKIELEPGEKRNVKFEIFESMLRFWDINNVFTSEPGEFEVFIGTNSRDTQCTHFKLI